MGMFWVAFGGADVLVIGLWKYSGKVLGDLMGRAEEFLRNDLTDPLGCLGSLEIASGWEETTRAIRAKKTRTETLPNPKHKMI